MQALWKLNTALAASLAALLLTAPNAAAQTKEKPPISVRPLEEQPADRVEDLEGRARDMIDARLNAAPPTMKNIKDMDGLRRIIEHNARENTLAAALDGKGVEDQLRKAGVDYDAIREFAEFLKNGPFAIERVEFIPGWDVADIAAGIVMDVGNVGKYDGGDFGAGLPAKDSLVARHIGGVYVPLPGGGYIQADYYSDGSMIVVADVETPTGSAVSIIVNNKDGLEFAQSWIRDENTGIGPRSFSDQRDSDEERSEALRAYRVLADRQAREYSERQRERAAAEGEQGDGDGGDTGGDDGNDGDSGSDGDEGQQTGGDGVDGYQPADGNEGSFCPNSVEYCRRGREQAEASGRTILTGMVLVNPGEPIEPMNAPRLMYDPEDFVINPDPNVAESNNARNAPAFQMIIPVQVNPPGPNDLNDLRDALGIDN